MPDAKRRRFRWPLALISLAVVAALIAGLFVILRWDLDTAANKLLTHRPAAAPAASAPATLRPSELPPELQVDLRQEAVAAANARDKVRGDRIVRRLVEKGTLKIEPGGRYLMTLEHWSAMTNEQRASMAVVFVMNNNIQPVTLWDPKTGEQLGGFVPHLPATRP